MKREFFSALLVVVVLTSLVGAANLRFTGTGGDGVSWNDPGNWSVGTVPTASDRALLDRDNDVTLLTGNTAICDRLRLALNDTSSMTIQENSTFTTDILRLVEGGSSTGTGTLNVMGDVTVTTTIQTQGAGGLATINQSGSSAVDVAGNLILAQNAGGAGIYNLSGGTVNATAFVVGRDGSGTLNMTDGTINLSTELWIGQTTGGSGNVQFDGGVINASNVVFGDNMDTMDITEGTLVIDDPNKEAYDAVETWVSNGNLSGYGVSSMSNIERTWDRGTELTTITAIPEPMTVALLGIGGLGMFARRRKA